MGSRAERRRKQKGEKKRVFNTPTEFLEWILKNSEEETLRDVLGINGYTLGTLVSISTNKIEDVIHQYFEEEGKIILKLKIHLEGEGDNLDGIKVVEEILKIKTGERLQKTEYYPIG